MRLTVTFTSNTPIYQQIRDEVVEGIAFGNLEAGEQLLSTRRLASDLGINFHTVNKACELRRQERLVLLNRKSGAVVAREGSLGGVAEDFAAEWSGRLRTLLAEGLDVVTALSSCQQVLGPAKGEMS